MAEVIINRGNGGAGRPLAGKDHVSGLVGFVPDANLPSGFTTTARVAKVYTIEELEAKGVEKGAANGLQVIWYHAKEYFRANPKGELYVGLFDSATPDMASIKDVQSYADGDIRQIGVFNSEVLSATQVTALQSAANDLSNEHRPLVVLYGADISAITDLTTLDDMRDQNSERVSVVVGQDGNSEGAFIAAGEGNSVTNLGLALGTMSASKVNENVGYVAKFNVKGGSTNEMNVPAFANGTLVSTMTEAELKAIDSKGYMFSRKYTDFAGTYFFDSPTATSVTSDFGQIERVRTMDKAVRGVRQDLLPLLNSPVQVNRNGSLTEEVIAIIKNAAGNSVGQMLVAGEISQYNIIINPEQDVVTTGEVEVIVEIVPVGVLRTITAKIGFKANVSN